MMARVPRFQTGAARGKAGVRLGCKGAAVAVWAVMLAALLALGPAQAAMANQGSDAGLAGTFAEAASAATNQAGEGAALPSLSSAMLSSDEPHVESISTADALVAWCKKGADYPQGLQLELTANLDFGQEVLALLATANPADAGILTVKGNVTIVMDDWTISVGLLTAKPFFFVESGASLTLGRTDASGNPSKGGIVGTSPNANAQPLAYVCSGATLTLAHRIQNINYQDGYGTSNGGVVTNRGTFKMADGGLILGCKVLSWNPVISNAGSMDVQEGTISGCEAGRYGIILNNDKLALGEDSTVTDCTTQDGPIIWSDAQSQITFSGTIEKCKTSKTAQSEGSEAIVFLDGSSFMTMTGGSIEDNSAAATAGAILVGNPKESATAILQVKGGCIANNVSAEGNGQIHVRKGGRARLEGGTVEGAEKNKQGCCATIDEDGELTIAGATLKANEDAEAAKGGLIYCAGSLTMESGTLDGSEALTYQGALVYLAKTATFDFRGGTLTGGAAAGDEHGNKGCGGAIYAEGAQVRLGDAGGNCTIANCYADNYGGAIYQEGGTLTLGAGLTIKSCKAGTSDTADKDETFGGAVYATGNATVALKDGATITSCSALAAGGGLYATAGATVTLRERATITGNSAKYGGGVAAGQGAIVNLYGAITGNKATELGGGVVLIGAAAQADAPTLNFCGGTILGNTSDRSVANNLFLDYLCASLPEGQQIASASTPAGNITVNLQVAAAGEVATVWVQAEALGISESASYGRTFVSRGASALQGFTYEGNPSVLKILADHDDNLVFVKASAQVSSLDDLARALASNGRTYFLTSDVHISSSSLPTAQFAALTASGTGVTLETSAYTISFSGKFSGCLIDVQGGSLAIRGRPDIPTITGVDWEGQSGQTAASLGAIHVQGGGELTLDNVTMRNCIAPEASSSADYPCGGAITNMGGKVHVGNSTIDSCVGYGGAICSVGGTVDIAKTSFANCGSTKNGIAAVIALPSSALPLFGATLSLDACTIASPQAQGGQSAIWVGSYNKLTATGGSIEGTKNALRGACLCVEPDASYVHQGATLVGGMATLGGCLYNRGNAIISGGEFKGGTACCGGAIYQSNGTLAIDMGTRFAGSQASSALPFDRSAIDASRVGESYYQACGGAIYLAYGVSIAVGQGVQFDGCTAGCAGGGIFAKCDYWPAFGERTQLSLSGDYANCQAGYAGGGLALMAGIVNMQSAKAQGCTAPYGGGVCQMHDSNVVLAGNTNISQNEGAADPAGATQAAGIPGLYGNYFFDATGEVSDELEKCRAAATASLAAQGATDGGFPDAQVYYPHLQAKGLTGTVVFSVKVDAGIELPYRAATVSIEAEAACFETDNPGCLVVAKGREVYLAAEGASPMDDDDDGRTIAETGDGAAVEFERGTAVAIAAASLLALLAALRRKERR